MRTGIPCPQSFVMLFTSTPAGGETVTRRPDSTAEHSRFAPTNVVCCERIAALSRLLSGMWVTPFGNWRTANSAIRTGSCAMSGKHPLSGLYPCSW